MTEPKLTTSLSSSCDDPRTAIVELCTEIRRPTGGPGGLSGPGFMPNPELLAAKLEKALLSLHDEIQVMKAREADRVREIEALRKQIGR